MIRTGQQYLDSLRDGREVYINGERVKDVTTHVMLKPLVDIRARIYDMQHESATRTLPWQTCVAMRRAAMPLIAIWSTKNWL